MAGFRSSCASRRSILVGTAAIVVSGAMLPLLAACGGTASTTTTASTALTTSAITAASGVATANTSAVSTAQASSASAAPTSQTAAGQKAQGSVTWLAPEDPLIDKWITTGIVTAFEKANPSITVQVISPGSTAYGQKLLALVAAGSTPEVFATWGGSSFFELADQKLLTNLTPYFGQAKVDTQYLLPEYVAEYSIDGQLYGVPWLSNPNFIVYNKTMFQKDNVPLPPSDWNDKSWTTDKLLAAAQALTHATGNPATSTFGLSMSAGTCGTLGWLWNADAFNNTGGPEASSVYQGQPLTAVYPDRQPMVDAMTWLSDLTLKYHVSPTPTDTKAMSAQGNPIFSGRLGMVEVAAGWLERQAAVAQPKFDWAIAPFPYGPGGKNTSQREDSAWYVGKGSKNPDAGFQLILYSSRGAGADSMITLAKNNPPLADTSYLDKWASDIVKIAGFSMTKDAFVSVFEGGIKAGFGDPTNIIDNVSEYSNAFDQIMGNVWIGKQPPMDGLQAVKQKWEGIIQATKKA